MEGFFCLSADEGKVKWERMEKPPDHVCKRHRKWGQNLSLKGAEVKDLLPFPSVTESPALPSVTEMDQSEQITALTSEEDTRTSLNAACVTWKQETWFSESAARQLDAPLHLHLTLKISQHPPLQARVTNQELCEDAWSFKDAVSERNRLCSTRMSEGRCGEQVEPVEPVRGGMLGEAGSVLGGHSSLMTEEEAETSPHHHWNMESIKGQINYEGYV